MKKYPLLLKISKRKRKVAGEFVLLVLFSVLFISIFPAQFENIEAVRKQLRSQANLIKERERKTGKLLSIKKEHDSLMRRLNNAHEKYFNEAEIAGFLKNINIIAEHKTKNNLLLMQPLSEKTIKPLSQIDNKGFTYKKKIIRLSVQGSFGTIRDLITRFDNYEKLVSIESIKMQEGRSSKIRAEIELAVYYLNKEELQGKSLERH